MFFFLNIFAKNMRRKKTEENKNQPEQEQTIDEKKNEKERTL